MSTTPPTRLSPSWIDRIPIIAAGLVIGGAGALTAIATRDVALATGAVSSQSYSWLLPVILEGGGVTAGLLAWRRNRAGERACPERLMLLLLILLAVVVNASHAAGGRPLLGPLLGIVLAASPPLVVIASVETLLRARAASEAVAQREREAAAHAERVAVAQRARAAHRDRLSAERSRVRERPRAQAAQSSGPLKREQQVTQVAEWLAIEGTSLNGPAVAERLNCSEATAKRRIAEAKGAPAKAA